MGLPGAVFEAPKRCQNPLKIGSEKWFRRPSGGRFWGDFWPPKRSPEAHFVLYFTGFPACRGVGEGTSKGLFWGSKKVFKNDPKMVPKRVPKGAPEGRPRLPKGHIGALRRPGRSWALPRAPAQSLCLLLVWALHLFVFLVLVLFFVLCVCCCSFVRSCCMPLCVFVFGCVFCFLLLCFCFMPSSSRCSKSALQFLGPPQRDMQHVPGCLRVVYWRC